MAGGDIKRIFVTGANGYIGSVFTQFAIAEGYTVHALSRTEESDARLKELGAVPVRGDLTSVDVIRDESAKADAVILFASAYALGMQSYDDIWHIDRASMDAAADAVQGTDKPLLVTSGTLFAEPDPTGAETTEASPRARDPVNSRGQAEDHALMLADKRGIRIMIIRLAPYVYGRGGSGVKSFMNMGAKVGSLPSIDGGKNHTTAVHVDDAARLYLLAMQQGRKGETYNASDETHVTARQLIGAMASILEIPLKDVTCEQAEESLGKLLPKFMSAENRASNAKARQEFGWQPREVGILDDILKGSYLDVAASLKTRTA